MSVTKCEDLETCKKRRQKKKYKKGKAKEERTWTGKVYDIGRVTWRRRRREKNK